MLMMFWIDLYIFCCICFWTGFETGLQCGWRYALREVFRKLGLSDDGDNH